ncbi:sugar nucleotide-binding protein [Vibrio ostreicida]|uniref:Sugar nucleotide-binding protein n=1 Tax=Vibrio ostreicida TaxID=526588 RepID=A0ABT8BXV1_9VIBR|nr:sugar nucleotide-binding protein [Vibrio ostreicida]MDN3611219.1 sugar nucleotide-binding protein [Vibrio ostreicida]
MTQASKIKNLLVAKKLGIFTATPTLKNITTEQFPTPAKRPVSSKLSTDKIERAFSIKASDWKSALDNVQIYTRS